LALLKGSIAINIGYPEIILTSLILDGSLMPLKIRGVKTMQKIIDLSKIPSASIEALYAGERGRLWDLRCDDPHFTALDDEYPIEEIFKCLGGENIRNHLSACMLGAGNARKEAALQALCGFHTTYIHGITVLEAENSRKLFLLQLQNRNVRQRTKIHILNGEFGKFPLPACDNIIAAGGTFNNTINTNKLIEYLGWLKEYCRKRGGKIILDYSHPFEGDPRFHKESIKNFDENKPENDWLAVAAAYHFGITPLQVELVHELEFLRNNDGYRIHILGRNMRDGDLVNLIRYGRYTNDFMKKIFNHCGLKINQLINCPVYTVAILEKK